MITQHEIAILERALENQDRSFREQYQIDDILNQLKVLVKR